MSIWKILLAVWFMLWGLLQISNFKFDGENLIMGCLAIAIAIFVFVAERKGENTT